MQNILIFPTKKTIQKTFFEKLKEFIDGRKQQKIAAYNKKIKFLKQQTYFFYLKKILKARKNSETKTIDFPDFIYLSGSAISMDAFRLSNIAVENAILKGHKHIDKCFKACVKQIAK